MCACLLVGPHHGNEDEHQHDHSSGMCINNLMKLDDVEVNPGCRKKTMNFAILINA